MRWRIALHKKNQSLHSQRLLFVDIKPDNFMLASSPSPGTGGKRGNGERSRKASASSSQSSSLVVSDICSRLRLIDFGLCESFRDMSSGAGGHRADAYPDAPVVGTPEYASLNVLDGHTPSRRDDLESVGYVVAEMVLTALASASKAREGEGEGEGGRRRRRIPSLLSSSLPWSACGSDGEIFAAKRDAVESGSLFALLAGGEARDETADSAASCLRGFFDLVRDLSYGERPDYDALMSVLRDMVVRIDPSAVGGGGSAKSDGGAKVIRSKENRPLASAAKSAKKGKPTAAAVETVTDGVTARAKRAAAKKVASSRSQNVVSVTTEAPTGEGAVGTGRGKEGGKRRRGRSGARAGAGIEVEAESPKDVIEIADSDDDDVGDVDGDDNIEGGDAEDFHTCCSGVEDEDAGVGWERCSPPPTDEDHPPVIVTAAAVSSSKTSEAGKKRIGNSGRNVGGAVLEIVFTSGPHSGESFPLGGLSGYDVVTVGRDPPQSKSAYSIAGDDMASSLHFKLSLVSAKGGAHSVKVTDLKSTNGTSVNGRAIPSGKHKQAFTGDKIEAGSSAMRIKRGKIEG